MSPGRTWAGSPAVSLAPGWFGNDNKTESKGGKGGLEYTVNNEGGGAWSHTP